MLLQKIHLNIQQFVRQYGYLPDWLGNAVDLEVQMLEREA